MRISTESFCRLLTGQSGKKLENIKNKIPKAGNISEYIWKNAGYPVYQNTDMFI